MGELFDIGGVWIKIPNPQQLSTNYCSTDFGESINGYILGPLGVCCGGRKLNVEMERFLSLFLSFQVMGSGDTVQNLGLYFMVSPFSLWS